VELVPKRTPPLANSGSHIHPVAFLKKVRYKIEQKTAKKIISKRILNNL
jgi:hypothetical protein